MKRLGFWAGLVYCLLFSHFLFSEIPEDRIIVIEQDFKGVAVGKYISFLKNPEVKLSLAKIKKDTLLYPFKIYNQDLIRLPGGWEPAPTYWLHFQIRNNTIEEKNLILEVDYPLVSELEFFEMLENDSVNSHSYTGNNFDFPTRQIAHRNFLFKVKLLPGATNDYYMYVNNKNDMVYLPLKLYEFSVFMAKDQAKLIRLGLYFGILFCVFLLNLIIFYSTRSFLFLVFNCYILSILAFHLNNNGLAFQYLWPLTKQWQNTAAYTLCFVNSFLLIRLLTNFCKDKVPFSSIFSYLYLFSFLFLLMAFLTFYESYFRDFFNNEWALTVNFAMHLFIIPAISLVFIIHRPRGRSSFFLILAALALPGVLLYYFYGQAVDNLYNNVFYQYCTLSLLAVLTVIFVNPLILLRNQESLQRLIAMKEIREKNRKSQKTA